MPTGWTCPSRGDLEAAQIAFYRDTMFNAASRRFEPRCTGCGDRVSFDAGRSTLAPAAPVLVISGSCASGKTTISYLLSEHYGFVQVDGDWILESRKAEEGRPVDFGEIHPYLLSMAEGLATLGRPVALAHVVTPEVVPQYKAWLSARCIRYRIVILMPALAPLLERNATRVCWPKTTPEFWVRRFYDGFLAAPDDIKALFYDNSSETPEETAAALALAVTGDQGLGLGADSQSPIPSP